MAPRNRSVGGEVPRKQITCKRLSKGRTGSNAAVSQEPPLVFDRPRGHGAAFPERSCPDFGDGQAGALAGSRGAGPHCRAIQRPKATSFRFIRRIAVGSVLLVHCISQDCV